MNTQVRCFQEQTEPMYQRFIHRPALERKSRVAILRGTDYAEAERMIRETLDLLDIKELCGRNEKVLIKPNLVLPTPPETAETTHPAIVAAFVKICKEAGAHVTVGESCAWDLPFEAVLEATGVKAAALKAGADEIIDFARAERVDVKIPGARSIRTASIPACVVEADVVINLPKMKNNFTTLTTLSIKNMFGLLKAEDRHQYHRTPWDMAHQRPLQNRQDKHRLTRRHHRVEGASPGRRSPVSLWPHPTRAAEAVANTIMGYNPSNRRMFGWEWRTDLERRPAVEIVGRNCTSHLSIPAVDAQVRFRLSNVTEFTEDLPRLPVGCCRSPRDAEKKYAVISERRPSLREPDSSLVWLVECSATRASSFPDCRKIKSRELVKFQLSGMDISHGE
jgi:hypothetical protein